MCSKLAYLTCYLDFDISELKQYLHRVHHAINTNMHSIAVEKLRNRSGFVINSYLKDGAFAAVTRASEF